METERDEVVVGIAGGQVVGWALLAIVNAVVIATRVGKPPGGWGVRVQHHVFDAGQLLAAGLLVSAAVSLWRRFAPRGRVWALSAITAAAAAVGFFTLPEDLAGLADRLAGTNLPATAIGAALVIVPSLGIGGAAALGALFDGRPWLRPLGVFGGVAAATVNQFVLVNLYPGLHLYLAWAAATVAGRSIAGVVIASARTRRVVLVERAVRAVFAAGAALAVAAWPSNAVLFQLFKIQGAVVAPFLARLRFRDADVVSTIPPDQSAWFVDRSGQPDVLPSGPALVGDDGIVILLTIDSFRADILLDPARRKVLPEIFRIRDESIEFTQARAAGSQTVYSLGSLFAGSYFSQQYWSSRPVQDGRDQLFPFEDKTERFPARLEHAGITTVTFASKYWLTNDWGIVRGFTEETVVDSEGTKYPSAEELVKPAIERLEKHGSGRMFLFMHFMDPHAPYDLARTDGPPFERYIAEIGLVDRQIARIRATLRAKGLESRTMLIVTSDHGEAFGEHATTQHATTLYDELLHVPLLVRLPVPVSKKIHTRVSLIDLGPTILDAFGVPSSAASMGQSLAPFLRGGTVDLTRPLIAEGRLKRSMVMRDGWKVVYDTRRGIVELYDLTRDPKELDNRFDDRPDAQQRLDVLRTFFQVHQIKRPGYTPPWRP